MKDEDRKQKLKAALDLQALLPPSSFILSPRWTFAAVGRKFADDPDGIPFVSTP